VLLQRMSERQWPFKRPDATAPGSAVASEAGGAGTPSSPAHGD
jgi:hypothetical protein